MLALDAAQSNENGEVHDEYAEVAQLGKIAYDAQSMRRSAQILVKGFTKKYSPKKTRKKRDNGKGKIPKPPISEAEAWCEYKPLILKPYQGIGQVRKGIFRGVLNICGAHHIWV